MDRSAQNLQGKILALVRADGSLSVGIRWRIYGFGGSAIWLRSIDGNTRSRIGLQELESLLLSRRLAICATDPFDDIKLLTLHK